MRVTSCPDCGEAVEIPPQSDEDEEDIEVTCQICGLSAPASEWRAYMPEDDESLLGLPLAAAAVPANVSKLWALRVEQLEEIREVVAELAHQTRLMRQALDELNIDLPEKIKRWFDKWHAEYLPVEPPATATPPTVAAEPVQVAEPADTSRRSKSQARETKSRPGANVQSGLW